MALSRRTFLVLAAGAAAAFAGVALVEVLPKLKPSAGSYTATYSDTY
jgi:hypothetical protein